MVDVKCLPGLSLLLYTCTVNNDGRAGNEDIFPEPAIKVSQSGVLSGISS